jgi:2-polyprenyl-6-methoxyphenol hydroxylase-like FAD-dependent oxidoreductase
VRGDVLIAGAGPTGLVLALWLTRMGVRVRVVDKAAEAGTTSRALAVQARTLELYGQMDLAAAVVERGHQVAAVALWVKGERAARVPLERIGAGLTPYGFMLTYPQDEHERLLIERLSQLGVAVERCTEIVDFSEQQQRIVARLRRADGTEERCEASYLAGCDGAHSAVREQLSTGFPGGTYRQLFYVADVDAAGPAINGELNIDLDEADFLAVFPLAGRGRARLVGTVRDERSEHPESLKFEDVSSRAIEHLKLSVERVNWFSSYRVHHRVAEHFSSGRAFLLGDAAHIHSPAGGQGMNTGIGDAINLAWKLAAVLDGRATPSLLDSYESERIRFARRLVATTDRAFTVASAQGALADVLRTRVFPWLAPIVMRQHVAREFLFRTVSQLSVEYRASPLSRGRAGAVHGGDRLPWVAMDGQDNFQSLAAMRWQVHIYGVARPELSAWCAQRGLPLHTFPWREAHAAAGLARDALYLLRPDTYVGLAEPSAAVGELERYFAEQQLESHPG